MRKNGIKVQRGHRKLRHLSGKPYIAAPNRLDQIFKVERPNEACAMGITHIQTWQGWLYLATVLDSYSRKVVGWSMQPTLEKELVLNAVLMAVWCR